MRLASIGLASMVLVLGAACSPGAREGAEADSWEGTYRIAYNVLHDADADDYEVFVMDLDGEGQRNLTGHPAVDWAYVAYGDRLFMVSDRDDEKRKYHLYEMSAGDGQLRRITEFRVRDSRMGLRKGGEELVVASSKDGTADLYLIDRRGNELQRLTDDDVYDNDPTFSPDGTRVVWRSKRSGTDELWVMHLTGGEPSRLTHYPEDDPALNEHAYHAGPPAWEPNRDLISFCSKRDGHNSVFTVRPDGSGLERITPDSLEACYHDWSPDGRFLAFDAADASGNWDIYLLEMDGGDLTRLTDGPAYEQAPIFVGL